MRVHLIFRAKRRVTKIYFLKNICKRQITVDTNQTKDKHLRVNLQNENRLNRFSRKWKKKECQHSN